MSFATSKPSYAQPTTGLAQPAAISQTSTTFVQPIPQQSFVQAGAPLPAGYTQQSSALPLSSGLSSQQSTLPLNTSGGLTQTPLPLQQAGYTLPPGATFIPDTAAPLGSTTFGAPITTGTTLGAPLTTGTTLGAPITTGTTLGAPLSGAALQPQPIVTPNAGPAVPNQPGLPNSEIELKKRMLDKHRDLKMKEAEMESNKEKKLEEKAEKHREKAVKWVGRGILVQNAKRHSEKADQLEVKAHEHHMKAESYKIEAKALEAERKSYEPPKEEKKAKAGAAGSKAPAKAGAQGGKTETTTTEKQVNKPDGTQVNKTEQQQTTQPSNNQQSNNQSNSQQSNNTQSLQKVDQSQDQAQTKPIGTGTN